MKTSTVGLVLAAILMALASVGFGIALAGGNHTDGPVLSFVDQEALGQSDHVYVLPSAIDLDSAADGTPSPDVTHVRGAVEAGSLYSKGNTDSSIVEIDGDTYYRTGGILYGPY